MGSVNSYSSAGGKRYRVRYRMPDGRQTDKRGFTNKREALEYLASVESRKSTGDYIAPSDSRSLVREWSEIWMDSLINLKPTTKSGYRYSLSRHILPRWGDASIGDIAHADIQRWVSELSRTLAASSVRQIYQVLRSMLKFAVRDRRISRNPADDVNLPRIKRSHRGYLTHDQVHRLAIAAGPWGDVLAVLAYTGLRWGELAGLRVKNLDTVSRRIKVVESVSEVGGQLVWGSPKNDQPRSVSFPRFLVPALEARAEGKTPEQLVFTSWLGAPLRNNNFRRRVFNPALAAVMANDPVFPKVTPHDLRHTAASLSVSAGANVKAIQRMLGHASAAMTLDVYADLFDDDLNTVSDALERAAAKHFQEPGWDRRPSPQTNRTRAQDPYGPGI